MALVDSDQRAMELEPDGVAWVASRTTEGSSMEAASGTRGF